MASFATDRDLLVLEPNLFRDVGWVGQRLTKGTGSVSGTTLTVTGADVALDAAGVGAGGVGGAGHVVTIAGAAYEVIERLSATQLTISRLRASRGDATIPPSAGAAGEVIVHTFAPQIAAAHGQVLAVAGLAEEGSVQAVKGARHEGQVLVDAALVRLESLGALALVWAAAAGALGAGTPAQQKAEWYRERFERDRERVEVKLDLDGDGAPDELVRLRWARLRRG